MAKEAANKLPADVLFAVLLARSGSLTLGDYRIVPFEVAVVPKEVAELVDTDVNPVKFFETPDAAAAAVEKLRADAAEKAKKPA